MATITTDTFLDTATGVRTAGETWTINGCTLTIRTDTRVYSGAPASMTGSLGAVSVDTSKGGSFVVDGTAVRWLAFNSGSGTVPAIGTAISQGGVSGYMLGVWTDLQAAPTSAAAAMPSAGFIKLREVNGGSFTAGPLTGISATAASPDVPGWIEVIFDAGVSITTQPLGQGQVFNGTWFYLDQTTGTRGQQIKTPTNGGGSTTHVFGVQIEKSPGSGIYEWYPTTTTTATAVGGQFWSTANLATDSRAKIVESMGNGVIRIGSDGTNNIGYLPPAGCNVRIPNIFGRTVATASRATNSVPGAVTRAAISASFLSINGLHADFTTPSVPLQLTMKNYVREFNLTISSMLNPFTLDNVCSGGFTNPASMLSSSETTGGSVTNSKFCCSGGSNAFSFSDVSGLTLDNIELVNVKDRTTSAIAALDLRGVSNSTVNKIKVRGCTVSNLYLCSNVTVTNFDYIDRTSGPTNANQPVNIFNIASNSNVTFDGLTFGDGGALTDTQPYQYFFNSNPSGGGLNDTVKIRNIGTRTSFLNCGSTSTIYPNSFVSWQSGDRNIKMQRIYLSGLRTAVAPVASNGNMLYEDCYFSSNYALALPSTSKNSTFRKVGHASTLSSGTAGTHWEDYFTSDTAGAVRWIGVMPLVNTQDKNYLVTTPALGTGYLGTTVSLDTNGDYAFSESPYYILGHTGFQNVAPSIVGSATGIVVYYDLDNGTGFRGTWTQATGANLAAETIAPTGFKMRVKIQQTGTGNYSTAIQHIVFATTSTVNDQANNMYPLDTVNLNFTGLQPGSEVYCYVGTNPSTAAMIGGTASVAGSTFSFSHSSGGQDGYIMVFALGYDAIYIPYTYKTTDDSILIQQIVDRNYYNPV